MKQTICRRNLKIIFGPVLLSACLFNLPVAVADTDPAAVEVENILRSAFDKATDLYRDGRLNNDTNLLHRALQQLDAALAQEPENVQMLRLKGSIQRDLVDLGGALDTYAKLLEINPDDKLAQHFLKMMESQINEPTVEAPDDAADIAELTAEGKLEEADSLLNTRLMDDPDNLELLLERGRIQRKQRNHLAAIETYNRVLKLKPDEQLAAALQSLVLLEASRTANADDKVTLLSQALKLSDQAPIIVDAFLNAAVATGKHKKITGLYEKISDRPHELNHNQLLQIAASYSAQGKHADAVPLFDQVLKQKPDHSDAATGLVNALASAGKTDQAVARITTLLKKQPNNPDLLYLQALYNYEKGNDLVALRLAKRVNALKKDHAKALLLRIKILEELGCFSVALELADTAGDAVEKAQRKRLKSKMADLRREWDAADSAVQEGAPDAGDMQLSRDTAADPGDRVFGLAYYDVPRTEDGKDGSVTLKKMIRQLEYLKGHGYRFVSLSDITSARMNKSKLPNKPALLTYEGAYYSFNAHVLPVLDEYGAPALLGVPTALVQSGAAPGDHPALMTWELIRRASRHRLVTLASRTHALEKYIQANPQGKLAIASVTRQHDAQSGQYESEEDYIDRIIGDLRESAKLIETHTGLVVDSVVWPEGAYNRVSHAVACDLNLTAHLGLSDALSPSKGDLGVISRNQASRATGFENLAKIIHDKLHPVIEVPGDSTSTLINLDDIAGETADQTREALEAYLAGLDFDASTSFHVKAYSDPDNDGNVESVYFPNRVLPVKQDILSHVTSVLSSKGHPVYVTMPTLSVMLPAGEYNPNFYVSEYRYGRTGQMCLWFQRLSPFSIKAADAMARIYSDLAAHVQFDGLLFENDGYLTDAEDYSPDAQSVYWWDLGLKERNSLRVEDADKSAWADIKTRQIDEFITNLRNAVSKYRLDASFERGLFARALSTPNSQTWLAQNYASALEKYDRVVISVTPETYGVEETREWLKSLVKSAQTYPRALNKTIFQIENYSLEQDLEIQTGEWMDRSEFLRQEGARHLLQPDSRPETVAANENENEEQQD